MGSKSSSVVSTSTETINQDQRIAAADSGIALASGSVASGATVNIQQLPPELANLLGQSVTAAQVSASKALDQQTQTTAIERDRYEETRKTLLVGVIGAVGLALALTMGGKHK